MNPEHRPHLFPSLVKPLFFSGGPTRGFGLNRILWFLARVNELGGRLVVSMKRRGPLGSLDGLPRILNVAQWLFLYFLPQCTLSFFLRFIRLIFQDGGFRIYQQLLTGELIIVFFVHFFLMMSEEEKIPVFFRRCFRRQILTFVSWFRSSLEVGIPLPVGVRLKSPTIFSIEGSLTKCGLGGLLGSIPNHQGGDFPP